MPSWSNFCPISRLSLQELSLSSYPRRNQMTKGMELQTCAHNQSTSPFKTSSIVVISFFDMDVPWEFDLPLEYKKGRKRRLYKRKTTQPYAKGWSVSHLTIKDSTLQLFSWANQLPFQSNLAKSKKSIFRWGIVVLQRWKNYIMQHTIVEF